jgi:aminoglycoside phosphotransferase family enzyme/predicted kinase
MKRSPGADVRGGAPDVGPPKEGRAASEIEPLDPEVPAALSRADAYPLDRGAAEGVESLQTHISHVFLTRDRVYKLRKAVRLPFLDFSRRAERDDDCWRELHLNRRLAPDVYLGVAPVLRGARGIEVGAPAEEPQETGAALESCLVMRRLPEGRDALSLLQFGELRAADLDAVARVLSGFHAAQGLGVPAPFTPEAWLAHMRGPAEACLDVLRGLDLPGDDRERLRDVSRRCEQRGLALAAAFERRRARGRAVDGHGDVHLQHVWFEVEGAAPVLIDCIEFDDALRRIDAAAEVAFLAMDLAYRRRGDLAEGFLRAYARESDDFDLYAVVDYHVAYRALVRAKVAGLAAADPGIDADQRFGAAGSVSRHLLLADRVLREPGRGRVVVLCGSVGSGKSTAAAALADATGGVVVATDRTRKRLAGLESADRGGAEAGLYAAAHSDRVYDALLERADPVLDSGRTVILDGAFSAAARRRGVWSWASRRAAPACLVEVRCGEEVARSRLKRREAENLDPSDAGPDLLDWSRDTFEPPDEWPAAWRIELESDADGWWQRVQALVSWIDEQAGHAGAGLAPCMQDPPAGGAE